MKYRIYNYMQQFTVVTFEDMKDILIWLNDNPIIINDCLIQYYDGRRKKWKNY